MSDQVYEETADTVLGWMGAGEIGNKLTEVDAMLMYLEMEADDLSSDMVALLRCARRIVRQIRQAYRPS